MKKVLLAGTALAGLVLAAAPAQAQGLNLDLGGHFRGYAVYADNDEPAGVADSEDFDLRRDSEIHFTGETTLDNGLTVGVHSELQLGDTTAANITDETYAYFSGNWGRLNVGSEDGAAYLLQVAAPSADSNVDGLRTYIQAFDTDLWPDSIRNGGSIRVDYDHADFEETDRLTYLTPKFSGFQAGISYAPESGQNATQDSFANPGIDDTINDFENLWEIAARWDGEWQGFGISAGAGYSHASLEAEAAVPAAGDFTDDLDSWNVGLGTTWGGFSLGGAYVNSNNGVDSNGDSDTWVVGGAWDNGPYHLGASYLSSDTETGPAAADFEVDRITVGGGYTFGPGMTFRGSVAYAMTDGGADDYDATQVAVGTDIQF